MADQRDVLAAVRPDPASGRAFLRALHRAYEDAGLDRDWSLFMVSSSSPGGPSYVWLSLKPADPCWQDEQAERRMLAAAREAFSLPPA